jgi:hypothetical protein
MERILLYAIYALTVNNFSVFHIFQSLISVHGTENKS